MEYSSTFIGDYLKKWLWQQGGSFSWVKNKMLALGYTKVLRKFPCLTIQEPLWQTHSHIWAGSNPFIATHTPHSETHQVSNSRVSDVHTPQMI